MTVAHRDVRSRLRHAALALFADNGYDATTVEDIASRAGVSRRSFFRNFRSKDDAVFPDHERLLARVEERLELHAGELPIEAVCSAITLVFDSYLDDPEVSLQRYRLIAGIPALRDRENASIAQYQRLLTSYLRKRLGDDEQDALRAEMAAASAVAAHNSVLRRWLHADCEGAPRADLARAFAQVRATFEGRPPPSAAPEEPPAVVAVFRTTLPLAALEDRLRRLPD